MLTHTWGKKIVSKNLLVGLLALLLSHGTQAEEEWLEEIVVTAQKRD